MPEGLVFTQSVPSSFWEEEAERLVDARWVGAARQVLEMGGTAAFRTGRSEMLLLKAARR